MHVGEVGIGYSPVTIGGSGGTPPYHWSISGGALPAGLSISSSAGTIGGSPTASGGFNFVVLLQDSAGQSAGVARAVTIVPYLTASGKCTQVCNVQIGCLTVCGAYTDLAGGVQPYQYQLSSGSIPYGTSLSGTALAGTFLQCDCGYPLRYPFSVSITDAFGAKATVNAVFVVYQHVFLASGSCYGNYGTGCTVALSVFGGTPGAKSTVTLVGEAQNPNPNPANNNPGQCWPPAATTPPPGYGLTDSGGVVTVTIPASILSGYGAIWTLTVTSSDLCGPGPTYCASPAATVVIGVQCG
jgi:hypothetical protein